MRVFVAGATGAIGKQLVPRLVESGHEVHGMTRRESKQEMLHELGAEPVVADALDPDQVAEAVGSARPEVIVHQLTALGGWGMRDLKRGAALTNRLRIEATDHLLSAGQAVGVRRFVAQSNYALYARTGGPVKSEEDPLDPAPPGKLREGFAAMRHLEEAVLGAGWTEGIALRYGGFYGPGTNLAPGGELFEMIRKRRFPLIGDGGGVWSFIHIADAAEATVAAVERVLAEGRVFCDEWEQASHGGELTGAVAAGVLGRDDVTDLGAVCAGLAEGRRSAEEITILDSTGLAIQDLAIALGALEALRAGAVKAQTVSL